MISGLRTQALGFEKAEEVAFNWNLQRSACKDVFKSHFRPLFVDSLFKVVSVFIRPLA